MGGQIRRGWIWHFWGAPIFSPEVPEYLFLKGFGTSGWKIGAPPKTPNSTTTDLTPHLRPSDLWSKILWGNYREGPKGSPQKGYPWSGRSLEISLRNYCIKCPKIREIWPFHGYPFCGYPFWPSSKLPKITLNYPKSHEKMLNCAKWLGVVLPYLLVSKNFLLFCLVWPD